MKICCFAGHSKIYEDTAALKSRVMQAAEELVLKQGVTEFWCGNYGAFDRLSASAIRDLKQTYKEITLALVIPYVTKEIEEYKEKYYANYDEIIVADIPENAPKKIHIIKANQYMVDNSDFLICYVRHSWGGAAMTLEYAEKKKIGIIKL